jgi:quinol monooxygenase YgiN
MTIKQVLVLGAAMIGSLVTGSAAAQEAGRYVQVAEIEIDPAQLASYRAAVQEQIEAAIRLEPGVLVLYAVAHQDNPARVIVFEIYRDTEAYRAHLHTEHFKKYKAATEKMVTSLKLVRTYPIVLGAKP